jgi:hypothetical protein
LADTTLLPTPPFPDATEMSVAMVPAVSLSMRGARRGSVRDTVVSDEVIVSVAGKMKSKIADLEQPDYTKTKSLCSIQQTDLCYSASLSFDEITLRRLPDDHAESEDRVHHRTSKYFADRLEPID